MAPSSDAVAKAYESPVLQWVLIVLLAAGLIVQVGGKIGGRVGATIRAWSSGRRRAAQETKDAEEADIKGQLDYLQQQVAAIRREQQAHNVVLVTHQRWDHAAMQEIPAASTIGPPPPLWPIEPTPADPPPTAA